MSVGIIIYFAIVGLAWYYWLQRWRHHWRVTGGNPLRLVISELVYVCIVGAFGGLAIVPLYCSYTTSSDSKVPTSLVLGMKAGFSKVKRGDRVLVELQTKEGKKAYWKRILALPGDRVEMQNGVLVRNDEAAPADGKLFPKSDGTIFPTVVPGGYVLLADHDPFDQKMAKAIAEDADYDKRLETLLRDVTEKKDATCILVPSDVLYARAWLSF